MADDARTEARRRIAAAIHRGHCGCADAGPEHEDGDPSYLEQADAVLELFPEVGYEGRCFCPDPISCEALEEVNGHPRWLVLHGPVEPVTEEREP